MDVALPENLEFNSKIIYIFYVISCQPLSCRDMPEQYSFINIYWFPNAIETLFRIYFIERP